MRRGSRGCQIKLGVFAIQVAAAAVYGVKRDDACDPSPLQAIEQVRKPRVFSQEIARVLEVYEFTIEVQDGAFEGFYIIFITPIPGMHLDPRVVLARNLHFREYRDLGSRLRSNQGCREFACIDTDCTTHGRESTDEPESHEAHA